MILIYQNNLNFIPGPKEDSYVFVWSTQPPLLQCWGPDVKNQRAQNVAAAQASILWCNHPKLLNHPAFHDGLMIRVQTLPSIPVVHELKHVIRITTSGFTYFYNKTVIYNINNTLKLQPFFFMKYSHCGQVFTSQSNMFKHMKLAPLACTIFPIDSAVRVY